jgi:hypothetical protein
MKPNALEMEPPYRDVLSGVLAFATFDEAERTIRRLENLCREYRSLSDKKGVEYCRRIAQLGRRRAEAISRNVKVDRHKRIQKQEIANWFRIWLETPALFEDWLSMRRNTKAFKRLLDPESGQTAGGLK